MPRFPSSSAAARPVPSIEHAVKFNIMLIVADNIARKPAFSTHDASIYRNLHVGVAVLVSQTIRKANTRRHPHQYRRQFFQGLQARQERRLPEEFDFRYNNRVALEIERAAKAAARMKRPTYRVAKHFRDKPQNFVMGI